MTFPWANTLLLLFIITEMISGLLGLLSGSPDRAIFIQSHRVAGFGILVIFVWKARNIRGSLRWHRASVPRTASLLLLLTLVVTLGLGFGWSQFGPFSFSRFSGLSWHVYAGAAILPVLIWHSISFTRGVPISFWADRRTFFRLTGITLLGVATWQSTELFARITNLRGANRRFTGSYEDSRFSDNKFPVVIWFNDRVQHIDPDAWSLAIGGATARELTLTYDDIVADSELTATIDCTGGWHSTQVWRGVAIADLLALAEPLETAASVTFTSATGYYRRFSMNEASRYLLATHVGDALLSRGHGFPVRLVAPGKRGYEWVKWVTRIEVNTTSKWLQPPLPLQ